ncbi:unnamed protein product [Peronospora belbahrii]|uniref:Fungal STAND N-terminal Goodbye domain-containing protein n=1 Tax=Peronospora belbahrii TaxID=622444 RepID=A0AAU9LBS5_9STRA|nr:unnamed protein product [Peronospora belbahrii]CAH0522446.1 unnamed protein product [Peronospora belbahrii]
MLFDTIRWMDASVVNPVATRLAGSVANPTVLSFILWKRLKTLTPQRTRDFMRLLTTALANALDVFRAERGHELRSKSKQLQKDFVYAASTRNGRDVVLNSVATVAKIAQALNTPETKAATEQLFQTLQSVVDFFASDDGRRIISSTGKCLTSVTEMTASPEASIFLAELATNLLHTLESEERRHHASHGQEEKDVKVKKEDEQNAPQEREMDQERNHKHAYSPTSSTTDTRWSFDTDSMLSSAPGTPVTGMDTARASEDGSMLSSSTALPGTRRQVSMSLPAKKSRSFRSARIEKEVLLRLGVDPSMLSEVQRVLDVIAAEERAEMQRQREEADYVASLVVPESTDVGIAPAFGNDEEEKNDQVNDGDESASLPASEEIPEWHKKPLREALRRRHAHTEAAMKQRDPATRQACEMAAVLAQRNIMHGDLQPGDIVACRTIARMIVYSAGFSLLLSGYLLSRNIFG